MKYYTVDAGVTVLGPYDGQLNNDGEDLELARPGDTEALTGEVPYILVELVEYNDAAPWPTAADGLGTSLERGDGLALSKRFRPLDGEYDAFAWNSGC